MAEMEDSPLSRLPQEITSNIFSRLPVESVLDSKLVCRAWRDFLQFHADTCFAYQHLLHQHGRELSQPANHPLEPDQGEGSDSDRMSFVFLDGHTAQGPQELCYAEYHDADKISDPTFSRKRIKINFPEDVCGIVGSCNGLICLSANSKYDSWDNTEPSYICNPITGEIVNLPRLSIQDYKKTSEYEVVLIAHGFGYHPLTSEYKVIRIWYIVDIIHQDKSSYKGQVEVYTLGSGVGWQCTGETNHNFCFYYTDWGATSGVSFNGAIHWISYHKGSNEVVVFDLVKEDFEVLPTPMGRLIPLYKLSLRVLRRSLCLVSEYNEHAYTYWDLDLLALPQSSKEEINSSTYHAKQLYECKSWRSPWNIPCILFACTRRGEILIAHNGVVYRYNRETRNFKENEIWQSKYEKSCVKPISHINSMVSLRALGEGSTKIYNDKESPDDDDGNILVSSGERRETKRFKPAAATSED